MVLDKPRLAGWLIEIGMEAGAARSLADEFARIFDDFAVKADLAATAAELRTETADLRADLRIEMAELRAEMREGFAQLRAETHKSIADLESRMLAAILHAQERSDDRIDALRRDMNFLFRLGIGVFFANLGLLFAIFMRI